MKVETPYELIAKQLNQVASKEELVILQQWIEDSNANRESYKQVLKTSKLQQAASFEPDIIMAWKRVNAANQMKINRVSRRTFVQRGLQIAAILIVLLGIGAVIQLMNWGNHPGWVSMETASNQQTITLDAATTVYLNRNSELSYPESFDGNTRTVSLKGEAFFKVTKNPQKPFVIKTKHTKTTVLGTSFNLRAYEREVIEQLTVTTGKVAFSSRKTDDQVILTPNQVGEFSSDHSNLRSYEMDDPNYKAWLDKHFVFNNTTLERVVLTLNHAYGVSIEIQNQSLAREHLSSSFQQQELDEVLGILSQTLDFEVVKKDHFNIIIK